jgi:hypothetical protein
MPVTLQQAQTNLLAIREESAKQARPKESGKTHPIYRKNNLAFRLGSKRAVSMGADPRSVLDARCSVPRGDLVIFCARPWIDWK